MNLLPLTPHGSTPVRVMTIAGSDSGGGAGIQADLHTMHDLGVHGCSVISAITAQNSSKVHSIQHTDPKCFRSQLQALKKATPLERLKSACSATKP